MTRYFTILLISMGLLATGASNSANAKPPTVVVSVAPVRALVAAVMQGIAEPTLLLRPGASPHDYRMRPSEARMLENAALVIWVGPELEGFLVKPITVLGASAQVLTLLDDPSITVLSGRSGGIWGAGETHSESRDPHIWLRPANAARILETVAATLGKLDPENRPRYHMNAARAVLEVGALEAEIGDLLAPVRDMPYIVFHDAYQYFEKTFRLNAKGALAVDPSRPPGARRLRELKQRIAAEQIGCVFREPDFKPATLAAVIEGTGAQIAELDPMGQVSGNLQAYASLIRNLARNLKSCLAP